MEWHAEPLDVVLDELDIDESGLTTAEAAARLEANGPNELVRGRQTSALSLLLSQFRNGLTYLLVFAALLSVAVGFLPGGSPEYTDALLILLILLGNGLFGFVQDYRTEQSIEALRALSTPEATVLRDGEKRTIDSREVVPGDVFVLEQGDVVPADARLLEAHSLATDESSLTGESASVRKAAAPSEQLPADAPLAERPNSVFMNTHAVQGRGVAVAVATGMDTEVGQIATQLGTTEEPPSPFQKEVDALGTRIGTATLAVVAVLALVQITVTDTSPLTVLLVAVTLAVAAVPEGLPAVVTLTLALGSRALLRKDALVRRLPVVESLGAVDTIVTDKTGTLTESRMTVRRAYASGERYELDAQSDGGEIETESEPLHELLRAGAICNDAERDGDGDGFRGDPTEVALLAAAAGAGVDSSSDRNERRLREVPFSAERKRMTVVVGGSEAEEGETKAGTAYVKGAPEVVLERCERELVDGRVVELTDERRREILAINDEFASDALRVLGFARRDGVEASSSDDELERGLTFLGLQGLMDPPRPEVADAVADCRRAGIRTVMATGDNLETAKAVGEELGFDPEGATTGATVESASDSELEQLVAETEIFARVSPTHKVEILRALQDSDHTVAMTGDGVNDAPALKRADVGVAMGRRGTDVARAAADMVLRDDNFTTIRDAIEAGRGVFDNVRKFVTYLLSANAGEVLVVFVGALLVAAFGGATAGGGATAADGATATAVVLTPVMLLWVNLVTDGLPALALGADPASAGVMDRPPRDDGDHVIDRRVLVSVGTVGGLIAATGLALFFYGLDNADATTARTLLFTFLVVIEMVRIQFIRARYGLSLGSNPWLVVAVASSFLLQLVVLYTPLAAFFGVVSLGATEWTWLGAAFLAFVAANLLLYLLSDQR
ncbi:cation-translocating P-type ATPase [Halorussus halophilus]|uniref:cation-translocating P-type ATPase n=1 Tax=Halorussus halophilus TaxID=2650975 RepID=UPI001300E707|nr:cation-transporting P-type ATPase [Halorussus halophilus]